MTTSPWAPPRPSQLSVPAAAGASATATIDVPTLRDAPTRPASRAPTIDLDPVDTAPTMRSLFPTAWLKACWLLAQIGSVVLAVVAPEAAPTCALASLGLMMIWSAVVATDVVRARPATVYSRPPRPWVAASSWLAPMAVIVAALVAVELVADSGVAADLSASERLSQIRTIVAVAAALPFLVALYLPYRVMGRATAWAGGSRLRWQHFFWVPVLLAVLAGLLRVLVAVSADLDADGVLTAAGQNARATDLGLLLVPSLAVWWLGWTAMSETERSARHTWERRRYANGSLDLSDDMVARSAAAAYLASRPAG